MWTKILYRKNLRKQNDLYFEFSQNHWLYVLPTFRVNSYNKSLREVSLVWLFWELSLYFTPMPNDCVNTATADPSKFSGLVNPPIRIQPN